MPCPPARCSVRSKPLGLDRYYSRYWLDIGGAGKGMVAVESDYGHWGCITTEEQLEELIAALDPRGVRESALRAALQKHKGAITAAMRKGALTGAESAADLAADKAADTARARGGARGGGSGGGGGSGAVAGPSAASAAAVGPSAAEPGCVEAAAAAAERAAGIVESAGGEVRA